MRGALLRGGRTKGLQSRPFVNTRSPRARSTHRANNGFRSNREKAEGSSRFWLTAEKEYLWYSAVDKVNIA